MKRFDHFPVSPQRSPVFYGWVVVAVGTLGVVSSAPGQTMGVGPFTEALMDALGLSRMQLSIGYALGTILSGFLITSGGRVIDRIGVRAMGVASSLLLAASLVVMAFCGEISEGIASAFGVTSAALVSLPVSVVAFLFLRFMGQGMTAMTGRVMIGKWFDRRRGFAIGLTGMFVSFGFGMCQIFFNFLIERLTWQGAYLALAVGVGVGMTIVTFIFYREQPEDFGLEKDGAVPVAEGDDETHALRLPQKDFTLGEAARSYTFWVFTAGLASQGLVVTAVTFHIISVAQEAGITKEHAFWLNLPLSLVLVATNVVFGWLSDRTKLRYLLAFMMCMQVTGTLALFYLGTIPGQVVFVAGFGISGGLFGLLVGSAWPRFYGMAHLGAITGLNMSVLVISTALGPPLFAVAHDLLGSYRAGFGICASIPAIVALLSIRAENPQPHGL